MEDQKSKAYSFFKNGQLDNCLQILVPIIQKIKKDKDLNSEVEKIFETVFLIYSKKKDFKNLENVLFDYFNLLEANSENSKKYLEKISNEVKISKNFSYKILIKVLFSIGKLDLFNTILLEYLEYCLSKRLIEEGINIVNHYKEKSHLSLNVFLLVFKLAQMQGNKQEIEKNLKIIIETVKKGGLKKNKDKNYLIEEIKYIISKNEHTYNHVIHNLVAKIQIYFDFDGKLESEIIRHFLMSIIIDSKYIESYLDFTEYLISKKKMIIAQELTNYVEREFAELVFNKSNELGKKLKSFRDEITKSKNTKKISDVDSDKTVALEDLDLEEEFSGVMNEVSVKILTNKELLLREFQEQVAKKNKTAALEIIIHLCDQYRSDPILQKTKEDFLELKDLKGVKTKSVRSSGTNKVVKHKVSKEERFIIKSLAENSIDNNFIFKDFFLFLLDMGFYSAIKKLIERELGKVDEKDNVKEWLQIKYFEIMALIAEKNFFEALSILESINNFQPLTEHERNCFLYLEGDLLLHLDREKDALKIFREINRKTKNYRLSAERVREIE